jgi:gliding motility-associated-like protein
MKATCVILLMISMLQTACKKEEGQLFAGCCNTEIICQGFGNATVFIPNIFTPNDDALNDYFLVFGNSIERIIKMEIRNKEEEVVFESSNTQANDQLSGWDGKTNGEVIRGLYSFIVEIKAADGATISCEGKVCNFPCGLNPTGGLLPVTNCRYPAQWIFRGNEEVDISDMPECE